MNDPDPSADGLDRTQLSLVPLFDDSGEKRYWHSRSSAERLRHVETLRRINYGRGATARLDRILELVPLDWR